MAVQRGIVKSFQPREDSCNPFCWISLATAARRRRCRDTIAVARRGTKTSATHHLQPDRRSRHRGQVATQVAWESLRLGMTDVAGVISRELRKWPGPLLVPMWTTERTSRRLSREIGQEEGTVNAVAVTPEGKVVSGGDYAVRCGLGIGGHGDEPIGHLYSRRLHAWRVESLATDVTVAGRQLDGGRQLSRRLSRTTCDSGGFWRIWRRGWPRPPFVTPRCSQLQRTRRRCARKSCSRMARSQQRQGRVRGLTRSRYCPGSALPASNRATAGRRRASRRRRKAAITPRARQSQLAAAPGQLGSRQDRPAASSTLWNRTGYRSTPGAAVLTSTPS